MTLPSLDSSASPIRVLIVDDSILIQTILKSMLADRPDIQVAGVATNGQEAIRQTVRLRPNVITMDIRMPQMDGLESIRHILRVQPTPIIVVASSIYAADYNIAFNALEAGALAVIEKPHGLDASDYEAARDQLITTIKAMAGVKVIARRDVSAIASRIGQMTAMLHSFVVRPFHIVAIGASTGGPAVIKQILGALPANFAAPIAVVQHVLPPFVAGLAEWLSTNGRLPVTVAQEGESLLSGHVYLAPGHCHMTVQPGNVIRLEKTEPVKGQRPSATRLFESVARTYHADAVGIILTGMGDDGVDGLVNLSQAGAHVIAQDRYSSVVFGMPAAAIERNIVDEVLSPDAIAIRLTKLHTHLRQLAQRSKAAPDQPARS